MTANMKKTTSSGSKSTPNVIRSKYTQTTLDDVKQYVQQHINGGRVTASWG